MSNAEDTQQFNEGTNSSDTIMFKTYRSGTLTFRLGNADHNYVLGTSDELELQLNSNTATISLSFSYGDNWPSGSTVNIADGTSTYTAPCKIDNVTTDSTLSMTVAEGIELLVFDPKIKVTPPPT
jgi:hypothetical protein